MKTSVQQVAVSDKIGTLRFGPISRLALALFCGGSGDHNPIHVDVDYARAAGLDDVVVPGMLQMAVLGQLVCQWAPQDSVREFKARFLRPVSVSDTLLCSGVVTQIRQQQNRRFAILELTGEVGGGVIVLTGSAVIELPAMDGAQANHSEMS